MLTTRELATIRARVESAYVPNVQFLQDCRTDVPALCREVRRLTAENAELRKRPTLEQVLNAVDNATWRSNESYRESAARVIRQLYGEEQPHG